MYDYYDPYEMYEYDEEYRQRMIEAFHKVGCDELIVLVALLTENDFKELEWLIENYYKKKDEIN